jgi:hypothetical protein
MVLTLFFFICTYSIVLYTNMSYFEAWVAEEINLEMFSRHDIIEILLGSS